MPSDVPAPVDRLLVAHALLAGLTPLIPVPLLDDAVRAAVHRRLVRRLAAHHGIRLGEAEVSVLSVEPGAGVLRRSTRALARFALRRMARKAFVFLAWKEAIDTMSRSYHKGWLLAHAFRIGRIPSIDAAGAERVRSAVEAACAAVSVTPLERVFREAVAGSRALFASAARRLVTLLGRRPPAEAEATLEEALPAADDTEAQALLGRLQAAIRRVPDAHFDSLRRHFEDALR
jgi:hypothetical protein